MVWIALFCVHVMASADKKHNQACGQRDTVQLRGIALILQQMQLAFLLSIISLSSVFVCNVHMCFCTFTNCISKGNEISSVCPFCHLNPLTFDPDLLHVCVCVERDHSLSGIEGQSYNAVSGTSCEGSSSMYKVQYLW